MSSGSFDYMQVITVNAQLEVENIGECAILGRDDMGKEYYIVVTTMMGQTEVVEYGPALPDFAALPPEVTYKYSRFDYSEFKIEKRIEKFLNSNPITFAEVRTIDEIRQLMRPLIDCVRT